MRIRKTKVSGHNARCPLCYKESYHDKELSPENYQEAVEASKLPKGTEALRFTIGNSREISCFICLKHATQIHIIIGELIDSQLEQSEIREKSNYNMKVWDVVTTDFG